MENENILTVTDENGQQVQIEVLDIFEVPAYPGKEYILYTKNEYEGDLVKTYVSTIIQNGEKAVLANIDDDAEFQVVQDMININLTEMSEDIDG